MRYRAQLLGGPYDGDRATIDFLPESVWAFACGSESCSLGGIHWTDDPREAEGRRGARYDLAPDQGEAEVWLYLYGEMTDPEALALATELARA